MAISSQRWRTLSGIVALSCVTTVRAGEIVIPTDLPNIQAGINAANNGDTVSVAPGSYNEAINFNGKAITVRSSGGALVTTITAAGLGVTSVVQFITNEGADSVLEGFTITGGTGTAVASPLERRGGGIYALSANPTIKSCRIVSNSAAPPPPNGRGFGGGVYHTGGTMTLIDCFISSNTSIGAGNPQANGGGLYSTGIPLLLRCKIQGNSVNPGGFGGLSVGNGGGAYATGAMFINCEVRGNSVAGASGFGGGAVGGALWVNCLIADNGIIFGGGAAPSAGGSGVTGAGTMIGCTVAGNTVNFAFGSAAGAASIRDCVVFNNGGATQVNASATVSNSCIQGGYAGPGNISADPLFVKAAAQDYHLQAGSPCRDAGDRTLLPADAYDLDGDGNATETLSRDLDLLRRIVNGQVDMGSYEWQHACLPDVSPSMPGVAGNGLINIDDLVAIITGWGDCDQCVADVNDDGHVNIDDLVLVITGWGRCPPS